MSIDNEGYYDGRVVAVEFEEDTYNPKAVSVRFDVQVDEPAAAVTCYHTTGTWRGGAYDDEKAERFAGILEVLEIDGIANLRKLADCVGRPVRVRAKIGKKGGMNYYIATKRKAEKLDESAVNARLDAFKSDETLPF